MNFGKQSLAILTTVAPFIATALGGPVAGLAVTKLEQLFGVNPGDEKALDAAVAGATPDQMLAMKKLDNDFKLQMADLGFREDQLAYADTASARAREEAVKDWTPRVIGVGVIVITLILEGALLLGFHKPTQVAGEVLGRILGTLDAATLLVLNYYFGSSAGARRGAEVIAQIAKQP